jgi:hypothetical protein
VLEVMEGDVLETVKDVHRVLKALEIVNGV